MKPTERLNKKFIRDCKLPIPTGKSPFFEYFIDMYEDLLSSRTLYKQFLDDIKDFNTEQEVFEYYNQLKESVIQFLKSSKEFDTLVNMDLNDYGVRSEYTSRDIFNTANSDSLALFTSIDIVKANYQIFRSLGNTLPNSYEELMRKFTDKQHFINSKYIRQVILGNLSPKRQVTLQKYKLNEALPEITKIFGKDSVVSFSNDEIVVRGYTDTDLVKLIKNKTGLDVRVETFSFFTCLHGYVKHFLNSPDKVEFKCVPMNLFAENYKTYFQKPVVDFDLVFEVDNRLVKFFEPEVYK